MTQNLRQYLVLVQRSAHDSGEYVNVLARDASGARVIARKAYATRHGLSAAYQTFASVAWPQA